MEGKNKSSHYKLSCCPDTHAYVKKCQQNCIYGKTNWLFILASHLVLVALLYKRAKYRRTKVTCYIIILYKLDNSANLYTAYIAQVYIHVAVHVTT